MLERFFSPFYGDNFAHKEKQSFDRKRQKKMSKFIVSSFIIARSSFEVLSSNQMELYGNSPQSNSVEVNQHQTQFIYGNKCERVWKFSGFSEIIFPARSIITATKKKRERVKVGQSH